MRCTVAAADTAGGRVPGIPAAAGQGRGDGRRGAVARGDGRCHRGAGVVRAPRGPFACCSVFFFLWCSRWVRCLLDPQSQLASAVAVRSPHEYIQWLQVYVRRLCRESAVRRLRELLDDLRGPTQYGRLALRWPDQVAWTDRFGDERGEGPAWYRLPTAGDWDPLIIVRPGPAPGPRAPNLTRLGRLDGAHGAGHAEATTSSHRAGRYAYGDDFPPDAPCTYFVWSVLTNVAQRMGSGCTGESGPAVSRLAEEYEDALAALDAAN